MTLLAHPKSDVSDLLGAYAFTDVGVHIRLRGVHVPRSLQQAEIYIVHTNGEGVNGNDGIRLCNIYGPSWDGRKLFGCITLKKLIIRRSRRLGIPIRWRVAQSCLHYGQG